MTYRSIKMLHDHVIEVPSSPEHDHEIYRNNSDKFWRKEIEKEMRASGVAFEILDEKHNAPCG